ncbi:arabinosyltransferase domain-containing protein [Pseudonocardia sp. N23]|uniref:arabinosyltransferase domain-containing protein n=1 Tax=Pseudonocardia sp. N23 TaxID=1987376 RepID=UPI000BFDB00D|nr:arabinosyltransferase domain-containing protein [Pseudonocardia sp. N23]GAY09191.1 probable arabinosyltransferase C [Pseudonocardia sp. N23]
MLSPVHAHEAGEATSDAGPPGGTRRIGPAHWALVLGLLTVLCAVAFPLAPVTQTEATYTWDAAAGPAAIPLMPYQPTSLQVTVGCAAVRTASPGTALLRTVPARTDPGAEPLAGLELTAGPGLTVRSAGVDVGTVDVPAGDCAVTVTSDGTATQVLVDGRPVLTAEGDLRPAVAGAFADVDAGQSMLLVADTRWETAISPLKAAIGAVCLAALVGTLVALGRCDRAARPRVRLVARPGRPRIVDAAVTVLLLGWWWIGPVTVDDGYIAGIVRGTDPNGFVGNGYRWLNAPEAPFSWFYELYAPWAAVSASTLWMRLPSTLLGIGCWLLLSRAVLPRLGAAARRRAVPWIAAVAFASWWLPFNLGMRPEPWVAVGTLAVLVAVERAVARRAVLPLAVALLLAGMTTAVTPGGIIAFAPVLAAVLPLLRLLRARRDLHVLPLVAGLLGAAAAPILLMFADQGLAAVLESVRVRREIGGGVPWSQEYERYSLLLDADDFQGAIGKRTPVLLTFLAAAGAAWSVAGRNRAGLAAGPVRRLVVAFAVSVVCLTATPTKWTQQFGVLAGLGAAVLTVAAVGWTTSALRVRTRGRTLVPVLAGTAALAAAGSLVLAGRDLWPYVSGWFPTEWGLHPPALAGRSISSLWLVVGVLAVVVVGGVAAWRAAAPGPGRPAARSGAPRLFPAPAWIALGLAVAILLVQIGGFTRSAVAHPGSYTLASDAAATLSGDPCGLEARLLVETDPAAGQLPSVGPLTTTAPTVAADVGGRLVPGLAVSGGGVTPWFALDPAQRSGDLPVVVTLSGTPGAASLVAEFAAAPGQPAGARQDVTTDVARPADVRLVAPAGAAVVRLVVEPGDGPAGTEVASLPRVPRLTPMTTLLPRGTAAILDWPVAFTFACLDPAPLRDGSAGLPEWRVAPPVTDASAGITYSPTSGGPFAAPRLLVTEERLPVYLAGAPTAEPVRLYRWVAAQGFTTLAPVVTDRDAWGWHSDGRVRTASARTTG